MLKTILVPLSGTASDRTALESALLIAEPFAAHLHATYVGPAVPDLVLDAGRNAHGTAGAAAHAAVEEFQHRSQAGLDAARTAYDAFCQRPGLQQVKTPTQSQRPSTWFSQYSGAWTDIVTRAARYHDLTVLQPGADAEDTRAGTVLLESGKPALIAPREPLPYPIRTIAIAWKDKPEAARAVTAAMPLLERARRVVVLIGNEDDHTATSCLDCADAIVSQLAWHGVRAESRYVVPEGRSLPDAVLDSAAEVSAELIVAGAYGRSRLRQWIFGGFTRRVLEGTSIPVFMAH